MKEANKKAEVLITESEPIIKKIELVNDGRDGVKVTYSTMETRNSVGSVVEYSKKAKRPCQRELRMHFSELRQHLLASSGYYWSNTNVLDMLAANVSVNYCLVTHSQDQFQVGGKMKVMNGSYTIAVNGPLIKNEDYDEYSQLSEILQNIKRETTLFMKGIKGADSKLVVIDYMIAKREIADAENEFDKMSKEEQDAMMREAFEDSGLILSEENGEVVVSVAEEKFSDDVNVERHTSIDFEEYSVEENQSSEAEIVIDNDADFELPITNFEDTKPKSKKK